MIALFIEIAVGRTVASYIAVREFESIETLDDVYALVDMVILEEAIGYMCGREEIGACSYQQFSEECFEEHSLQSPALHAKYIMDGNIHHIDCEPIFNRLLPKAFERAREQ